MDFSRLRRQYLMEVTFCPIHKETLNESLPRVPKFKGQTPTTERERVMSLGFTEEEAECWVLAASVAGKFFSLPDLHQMDDHEVAHAIHVVQSKLLSRPAYRRYLDLAREGTS